MNFFRQILSLVLTKQTLVFIALVLVGLAIWFVGPMISFGGIKPLADIGLRITTIILLLVLFLFVLLRWPVSAIGITAFCLLIWHAFPIVSFGASQPFAPIWVRVLLICLVLFAYGLYMLYRLWLALRANENLLQKILHPHSEKPAESNLAKEQLQEVNSKLDGAIRQLKRLRLHSTGVRKLFEGKQYIYELPWYMIVGSPGAGKTTALLNSGLKFPLADQLGATHIKGVAGTHNCDWWFTNEAVLIDTAGRYVTHESDPSADAAEWGGFLGLLRKYRPRAPINGAILTLSAQDLLESNSEQLTKDIASMRARLDELRVELGIRFPIYVVVTKTDLLPGFEEYFHQLTAAGRAQTWGFTLAYDSETSLGTSALKLKCKEELKLLTSQLERGVNERLHEEYDVDRRCKLYAFPDEFDGLANRLETVIDKLFLSSKYDDTQNLTTLRGVYFTSAAQTAYKEVVADKTSILQRFKYLFESNKRENHSIAVDEFGYQESGIPELEEFDNKAIAEDRPVEVDEILARKADESSNRSFQGVTGAQSYFLQELFQKLIFQEAHLVKPNLRWEFRYRLIRMLGHALVAILFLWLLSGLWSSHKNNQAYLTSVDIKTEKLSQTLEAYQKQTQTGLVPDVLDAAESIPKYKGLDLVSPDSSFKYGLYTGDIIDDAAQKTYHNLQDGLLLPFIIQRLETTMLEGMRNKNAEESYNALRVYLMLHDKDRFDAKDVQAWVLKDLQTQDSTATFGGKASVAQHISNMFDGERIIQSSQTANQELINQTRQYLSSTTSIQRLYERAKADMQLEAPTEFALTKAVGPQVAIVFSRKSGQSLDKGVPGLFTIDGYRQLFSKRLVEFVTKAEIDDVWVMGQIGAQKKNVELDPDQLKEKLNSPIVQEIRRMYLTEYATLWQRFLEDIRIASDSNELGAANVAYEMNIARILAGADSPLNRLARAVVKETTLASSIDVTTPSNGTTLDEKSAEAKKAAADAQKNLQAASNGLGMFDMQLERDLVDNRFAALREVVTGQADARAAAASNPSGSKLGMDGINALLNEYYNSLVVSDNAIKASLMPPVSDIFNKIQLEASKYPAPLNVILNDFAFHGQKKTNQAIGELLIKQTNEQVGNFCMQAIAGRYPFNRSSTVEASADDFTMLFSKDGLLDKFFQKNLQPIVDTSTRPWRYKLSSTPDAPILGPNLASFEQADVIRQLFFSDLPAPNINSASSAPQLSSATSTQGHRIAWRMDMSVANLDPNITQLFINIDGQSQRYVHGPVLPISVSWPGPRGGVTAELSAVHRDRMSRSSVGATGPWALFHLLDKARITNTISPNRFTATYDFGGRLAVLDISSSGLPNPFYSDILQSFQCPSVIKQQTLPQTMSVRP